MKKNKENYNWKTKQEEVSKNNGREDDRFW